MVLWSTVSLLIIINKYWTRLSRSIICLSLQFWRWQIIIFYNNWVQKLFNHLITKFVFNEYLWEAKQSALSRKSDCKEGEKHGFIYVWAEYYLQPNTVGRHCAWADHWKGTKICIEWYTCMVYHTCICHHCIKFENKLLPPRTSRSYSW